MKVFIENEAGSTTKNLHNEKTLEFKKSVEVSEPYPYPYGFILDTTSPDGDNLDCFILTDKQLRCGDIVECEPIALMRQMENGIEDFNVVAVLPNSEVGLTDDVKQELTDFIKNVFRHVAAIKTMTVEGFDDSNAALAYIEAHKDK